MNIKQLESLVSIVENGGFAAAAERLHTTQSAVSARIKELEKYLGIALFDRSSHRARLTAKGEELLPYARQLVQLAQQATQRVSDPNSLSGILRIGAVGLIARRQLPRLIMEVRQRYPNVELRVEIDLARTVLEKFQDGEIDLALTTAPVKEANVDVLPIGHDHFVWLTCPSRICWEPGSWPPRSRTMVRSGVSGGVASFSNYQCVVHQQRRRLCAGRLMQQHGCSGEPDRIGGRCRAVAKKILRGCDQ